MIIGNEPHFVTDSFFPVLIRNAARILDVSPQQAIGRKSIRNIAKYFCHSEHISGSGMKYFTSTHDLRGTLHSIN